MTYSISDDSQWFSRSKYDGGKSDRKFFAEKGYCAVYIAGRLGPTARLDREGSTQDRRDRSRPDLGVQAHCCGAHPSGRVEDAGIAFT